LILLANSVTLSGADPLRDSPLDAGALPVERGEARSWTSQRQAFDERAEFLRHSTLAPITVRLPCRAGQLALAAALDPPFGGAQREVSFSGDGG
jgi:hypothetical protein